MVYANHLCVLCGIFPFSFSLGSWNHGQLFYWEEYFPLDLSSLKCKLVTCLARGWSFAIVRSMKHCPNIEPNPPPPSYQLYSLQKMEPVGFTHGVNVGTSVLVHTWNARI